MRNYNFSPVAKAEALFTAFLVEHNLPLSVADHAGPLFKMFPDSAIAKKYKCGQTKTREVVTVLATEAREETIEHRYLNANFLLVRDLKKNKSLLMIMYTKMSWEDDTCFINFNFCFCLVKLISKIGYKKYTSKVSIFYVSISYGSSCEDFLGLKYDESPPKKSSIVTLLFLISIYRWLQ